MLRIHLTEMTAFVEVTHVRVPNRSERCYANPELIVDLVRLTNADARLSMSASRKHSCIE